MIASPATAPATTRIRSVPRCCRVNSGSDCARDPTLAASPTAAQPAKANGSHRSGRTFGPTRYSDPASSSVGGR